MAEIRLNKIMRQFNIGLQDLVDFLKAQGADVEENPNAKFSDEYLPAIQKQFGADLKAAEEANERAIKMSDILENSGKKKEDLVEEEEEEPEEFEIVRRKQFSIKPMSVEEAILQMNLLEHEFFVFRDEGSDGAISVVYRRNKGGYGLISDDSE